MSRRFEQNAGIDLSAQYAADDAHFGRNALGAGVVSVSEIAAQSHPEIDAIMASLPSVRHGRCPKCKEQTSSADPCCGIDPWEDGE